MSTYQPTFQRVGVDSKVYDPEPAEERRGRRYRLLAAVIGLLMLCAIAMTAGFWFERIGLTNEMSAVVAKGFPFSAGNNNGNSPAGAKFIATFTYTPTRRATNPAIIRPSNTATRPATATSIPATATLVPATATVVPPTEIPPTAVPPTAAAPTDSPTQVVLQPTAAPTVGSILPTDAPGLEVQAPTGETAAPTAELEELAGTQPAAAATAPAETALPAEIPVIDPTAAPTEEPALVDEQATITVDTITVGAPEETASTPAPDAMLQAATPSVTPSVAIPTVWVIPADPAAIASATAIGALGDQQAGATATPQATATALPQTGGGAQFRLKELLGLAVLLAVIMLLARWLRIAHQKI